eukprot:jgi/Botrbrau1/22135/Bobra.0206s0059.1
MIWHSPCQETTDCSPKANCIIDVVPPCADVIPYQFFRDSNRVAPLGRLFISPSATPPTLQQTLFCVMMHLRVSKLIPPTAEAASAGRIIQK